jgi:hypothetical protein
MTNFELDGIELILTITSQVISKLASPGRKRKTKAMSAHSTSISLGRCVINLENIKH